jgi:spermidine synthase
VLTNSYYDEFATLMPLLPDGPVGIYGLGAGATAHIIQHFWPAVTMHGWELDPDIITVARQFFNLAQLEVEPEKRLSASEDAVLDGFECNHAEDSPVVKACGKEDGNISVKPASTEGDNDHVAVNARTETQSGRKSGKLFVYIGDALASDATVEGGFAGLIVDLFAHGAVIPPLMLPETWEQLKSRLRPEGDQILELQKYCLRKLHQCYLTSVVSSYAKAFKEHDICFLDLRAGTCCRY